MKKVKLFQIGTFVLLVIVFSSIGIAINARYGLSFGIGFTMLALPVILRLIRVKYWNLEAR